MKDKVVLLLDDEDESFIRSLRDPLSSETWAVVRAENVPRVIAMSGAGEMDLLVMTLDSPTAAGWEAIDRITEENPFLPVIVISARPDLTSLAEAAGARALVMKPVNGPALLQNMRELLAEGLQSRMRRTFDREADFRQVPASTEGLHERFHRPHSAPSVMAPQHHHGGINE